MLFTVHLFLKMVSLVIVSLHRLCSSNGRLVMGSVEY